MSDQKHFVDSSPAAPRAEKHDDPLRMIASVRAAGA